MWYLTNLREQRVNFSVDLYDIEHNGLNAIEKDFASARSFFCYQGQKS